MKIGAFLLGMAFIATAWAENTSTPYDATLDVERLSKEVAQLRARIATLERSIQLLMDANPGVKANVALKLKEDEEARAQKAAKERKELDDAVTVVEVSSNGHEITMRDGSVWKTDRQVKWAPPTRLMAKYHNGPATPVDDGAPGGWYFLDPLTQTSTRAEQIKNAKAVFRPEDYLIKLEK